MPSSLFPVPTHLSQSSPNAANSLLPAVWPGVSVSSTDTLRQLMTKNWDEHHIFFNNMRFHNHIIHHLLTIWSLGAQKAVLEKSYADEASYQRKLIPSPSPITNENWKDYLGDENYYTGYRTFFLDEIKRTGSAAEVLETYVFSASANVGSGEGAKAAPQMLVRFMEGLVHPMIHTGFGCEFGLDEVVAEGLAQTAVHRATIGSIIPAEWFSAPSQVESSTHKDVHALTILARILSEPSLKLTPNDIQSRIPPPSVAEVLKLRGDSLKKHIAPWVDGLDGLSPEALKAKVEELVWLNTVLYAVGGTTNDGFKSDFFLMHLVTSSLFLPSLVQTLPTSSQILLLKAYVSTSFAWYIARGRPEIDIPRFYNLSDPTINQDATGTNPWLSLVHKSILNHDDHIPKLQRAFVTWDAHLGTTNKGAFDGKVELEGAEQLDGSLFVRAGALAMERIEELERRKGGMMGMWDREGFF